MEPGPGADRTWRCRSAPADFAGPGILVRPRYPISHHHRLQAFRHSWVQSAGNQSHSMGGLMFTARWQLTLYFDGSYNFNGSFTDPDAFDYDDRRRVRVASSTGVLYTFTHSGSMQGWLYRWIEGGSETGQLEQHGYQRCYSRGMGRPLRWMELASERRGKLGPRGSVKGPRSHHQRSGNSRLGHRRGFLTRVG